jgi:hypothetical protein
MISLWESTGRHFFNLDMPREYGTHLNQYIHTDTQGFPFTFPHTWYANHEDHWYYCCTIIVLLSPKAHSGGRPTYHTYLYAIRSSNPYSICSTAAMQCNPTPTNCGRHRHVQYMRRLPGRKINALLLLVLKSMFRRAQTYGYETFRFSKLNFKRLLLSVHYPGLF